MKKIIIALFALNLMLFAVGCSNDKNIKEQPTEVTQGVTVEEPSVDEPIVDEPIVDEPTGDAADPSKMILAGADEAKQIDVATIKTIALFDLDGKDLEKTFSADEITTIGTAYNNSMIDDISYIEMLAGYSMDITLDNDQVIHLTSYGDENHVVATTNGTTYHLICPEIGKILLTVIE